jgi:hypothetical protein
MAEEEVVTTEEEVVSETQVGLSINELAGAVSIIDICSERGAFKGPELEEVGVLRGKFAAFIKANLPNKEGSPEEADAADAP